MPRPERDRIDLAPDEARRAGRPGSQTPQDVRGHGQVARGVAALTGNRKLPLQKGAGVVPASCPGGSCARPPNPSGTIMPACPSGIRPRTVGLIHASQSGMRLKIPFQLIFGHWHDHICENFCVLFTNFPFTACACSRSRDIRACLPPPHNTQPGRRRRCRRVSQERAPPDLRAGRDVIPVLILVARTCHRRESFHAQPWIRWSGI